MASSNFFGQIRGMPIAFEWLFANLSGQCEKQPFGRSSPHQKKSLDLDRSQQSQYRTKSLKKLAEQGLMEVTTYHVTLFHEPD
jgi:hypothetical protein